MRGDLAEFLRARRALVGPAAVGLPGSGRRHVRGLRREELALTARISVDYYVRLEQGRDRHPSAEVVGALARALCLDADATTHLHRLAGSPPSTQREYDAAVRPSVARLVDSSPWPAVLLDHRLTVVYANTLASLLHPGHAVGRNLVRDAFLDPATGHRHVDPAGVRAECAAALRSAVGVHAGDPVLQRLVGELTMRSDEFVRLWARADVSFCRTGKKVFDHPAVGVVSLDYETLDVGDSGGLRLLVHSAEPGTPDGDRLALILSGKRCHGGQGRTAGVQ
ncbi:helix-turn-helix domain-containing protein [Actinoplanes couchii]|uniref:Transcriptional regulator n=1 Tax=Actinoplanes couchii TaxID=403638 RepID=A0ABQ3XL52_9ACTN|nr:helix-turn-helix transcriptional regulator [Actinoplanes couchii]MDR6318411.1 transcriptional regulator with XRE-family HTH domain [Actinoplanes couchii]GID59223.1 transcriptional regulator [Actinoplanes couchii]